MQRRIQQLEAQVAELKELRADIRELRAHLDSQTPEREPSLRSKVSRRLRRLLELARSR